MSADETAPAAADRSEQPARFDESLAELEQLVEKLEQGDLSLEESLEQFERGVTLARQCKESLAAAEQKVQILSGDGESESLADFPNDNDSGS